MTNEEHERMLRAFVAKARRFPGGNLDRVPDEDLRGLVGTVIADTVLVTEGTIPIEAYENEDWIRPPPVGEHGPETVDLPDGGEIERTT